MRLALFSYPESDDDLMYTTIFRRKEVCEWILMNLKISWLKI